MRPAEDGIQQGRCVVVSHINSMKYSSQDIMCEARMMTLYRHIVAITIHIVRAATSTLGALREKFG